ncbi:putative ABC transporter, AAA+ ATPase domain, ABC-2 type transporter [Dioscorea sansibarensis]
MNKLPFFKSSHSMAGWLSGHQKHVHNRKGVETQAPTEVELGIGISGETDKPAPSFRLSFTDLTYSVKKRRRETDKFLLCCRSPEPEMKKMVLDSISGEAKDGEILAVFGASGSGKSTLIDALAHRISRESLKGCITLNGEPLSGALLRSISAYVMQDDLLFPMLTVEETLMFSAEFRLPRSLSKAKKKARVQNLMDQLGLRDAAGTIIGDEGHRGISGGERRRVSIGIDIVHDPVLLFLDEPTSGLDSTSAFMVVKVLKNIAETGSIIIMSVHQPSSRIVELLDHLIILSQGRTAYTGTPGDMPSFFSDFGRPVPENENPTEFALDLIRELESSNSTEPLIEFNRTWNNNKNNHRGPSELSPEALPLQAAIAGSIAKGKLVTKESGFANPVHIETAVLTKRSLTNMRRMPELFLMRFSAVFITGFILATIFWKLDNSPKGARERLGFFAFAMSTMFYTTADALPVFLHERYIFMRETSYNAYRRSSYVLSNAIASFPALVVLSVTFAVTTFFAVGLAGGSHGFFFYFLMILASFWTGSSFVSFISGVVSHVIVGYVVVVAILAYFLLFCGFFINRNRIPSYWIWFHYLSLVKYPYEAVMQSEFHDSVKCFVKGIQIFDGSPLGGLSDGMKVKVLKAISNALGVNITRDTCVTNGRDILQQQGINDLSKWNCFWVTIAWGFFFRILFYFALLIGSKNKRR